MSSTTRRNVTNFQLDRRNFMRGAGVVMGLPWLEAMMSSTSLAAAPTAAVPTRMAFVFFANGA
ncbi:MAG TPA: hypothetical protein DIW81_22975, partial [Planctomycetaceae bacterium]|nr:hypothetical protein [Planctomycetaceae bacterium]